MPGVLLGLLLVGCGPGTPSSRPFSDYNVLIIVMDALRADHLGAYGYSRPTSPFIDKLAREGILFERAHSNSSYTNESVSALFSGQLASTNPWGAGWHARPNPDSPALAMHFQEAGYATALFSNTAQLNFPGFFRGFDETDCYAKYGHSQLAPRLVERALRFARDHRARRTFMYLHFLDPHSPYDPPEDYYRRFTAAPLPKEQRLRMHEDVRPQLPELTASGFGRGETRFEDMVSRYDAEIAFVDAHLRKLFDGLRELGVLDRTLVVFLSDHGEEFLEHGFVEHAWRLYWESVHIPLIFWAPGVLEVQRIDTPVSIVDLMPTLLKLNGISPKSSRLDGTPLFAFEQGRWRFAAPERPIVTELLIQTRNLLRMVYAGGYAYLSAVTWMTPAQCSAAAAAQTDLRRDLASGTTRPHDTWAPAAHEEFYDMSADPAQRNNLMAHPPTVRLEEFRAILDALRARCPQPVSDTEKLKIEMPAMPPEMKQQLEALGYGDSESATQDTAPDTMDPAVQEQLRDLGYL